MKYLILLAMIGTAHAGQCTATYHQGNVAYSEKTMSCYDCAEERRKYRQVWAKKVKCRAVKKRKVPMHRNSVPVESVTVKGGW